MHSALFGFGDQSGDRLTGWAEHRSFRAGVRVPADARRVPVVIGEEALHVAQRDRAKLAVEQRSYPIESRE